jgi:hypothetical protein
VHRDRGLDRQDDRIPLVEHHSGGRPERVELLDGDVRILVPVTLETSQVELLAVDLDSDAAVD